MNNIKWILWLGLIVFICSCQAGKKEPSREPQEETNGFVAHLTQSDTVAVEALVRQFMEHVEGGHLAEAVAMLYKADPSDVWGEPLQLDNEEMRQVKQTLGCFPVLRYQIDYIKFQSAVKNEVKCTIVMREAEGELPAVTNRWYFKPMNYLGGWRLCMMDSF